MPRATVIIPWIGQLPEWTDRFLERVSHSTAFKFVIVNHDWPWFVNRIYSTTGMAAPLNPDSRKICDFRPAFGNIFAEEIGNSEFFGWADLDCVFGDLDKFVAPRMSTYDVITDHQKIINGPFCIVRTSLRDLYRNAPQDLFTNPEYYNFDEDGRPSGSSHQFPNFTSLVACHRTLFLNAHRHDRQHRPPMLINDALLCEGEEIMTYHFTSNKQWGWPITNREL